MSSEALLPLLILIPFIGGLLAWLSEKQSTALPRWIALFTMTVVFGLSLYLWLGHDFTLDKLTATGAPTWTLEFNRIWIERLGINFHLALDGLSVLMLLLTGGLGLGAVICSWREIDRHVGFFYLNLLWNLGGVIGVFLAVDLFLFFFFWELMLVPMYFLIALWGHNAPDGKGRIYAANKFFIFTQASGLLLLLAILGLVFVNYDATGILTFSYAALLETPMAPAVEMTLMLGFFLAFAVKLPVFPVHSWLPDAHAQAPTAGSVDLAGVLLKTAGYGLLRFGVPLFPNAAVEFAPIAMWLGVIGIFYGAVLACAQTDIKRLIAYTSVSHMGFVLIGIYAGNTLALQGVVIQMMAHGLSAGALFILSGEIYERMHTRDLREMGGLWTRLRYLPPIALFFSAASLGMPGLGNFVGEFLILMGTYPIDPLVSIVATGGLILAAVYSLMMIQKAFYGKGKSDTPLEDLNGRELSLMLSLLVLLVMLGVYPQPILDTSASSMNVIEQIFNPPAVALPAVTPTVTTGL
ncbi:MAG: NADH-quinone oxidoreductase subunit M [Moraxellaceae bacterium]|jgi:NADH-quinone oxidoreductase subunit M|nr:NADH-quinone oxidoreductase subunit M [Moraxellaceae bacterium]MBP7229006.1 NADH-quinone oxidoreductase subunit M [Moraxellaceae bacterium]MBP8852232.1 NADH-quinone oxidoreductase subunit M [Moraxellaceae bacterium]MBP9045579.1 NADH-quinone oxidoreductase subunit M [Moraxellaceae bacterium]MBP9730782.1 NADH-quinone oxidoreductase subunit M [Moraxellaceae bacterium]